MQDAPAVKGAMVSNGVKAIRALSEPAAFDALVRGLSPDAQALIQSPPLPTDWVPLPLRFEIFDRAFVELFHADLEKMYEVGRYAHQASFKAAYRVFIKVLSPVLILSRMKPAWQTIVRNCGTLSELGHGDNWLELEYAGQPMPAPWFWEYNRGGMAGLAGLTRVRDVKVDIIKGGGRAAHCAYHVAWSPLFF